ncbi:MAG: hypothetical protein HYV09_10885 [Deltaproteobacteria bacterium]|nr:hypothetical protein [Deltaproteobacteria bacterium]
MDHAEGGVADKAAMLSRGTERKRDDAVSAEEELKDPLVLEFLDLKDEYSESDAEEALIHRLALPPQRASAIPCTRALRSDSPRSSGFVDSVQKRSNPVGDAKRAPK